MRGLAIAIAAVAGAAASGCHRAHDVEMTGIALRPDQEQKLADQPLSGSTHSINRYQSILSRVDTVDLSYEARSNRLRVRLHDHDKGDRPIEYDEIDARFVVPLLPYPHGRTVTAFDKVNLMLAEYSRNGVELALQDHNSEYGYVSAHPGFFNDDEEYRFEAGKVIPNPGAKPKRMGLVNNCLFPGLWEINASDSVGEMYHAWFTLPAHGYMELVRAVDDIDMPDAELKAALDYQKQLPKVASDLARLRSVERSWGPLPVAINTGKAIASYSTQDSRRKVQRKFYRVERDGKPIEANTFADLKAGDHFKFFSFVPPGIYTNREMHDVVYEPIWTQATLAQVTPRTRYGRTPPATAKGGALEVTLRSSDGSRALVIGNLPLDYLVFQEDYDIPGFGVGVMRASEPIERRKLFLDSGPQPVFAYSTRVDGDRFEILNNHEQGLEQAYLRPYRDGEKVGLRITLVAYERIVDILEVQLDLPEELAQRVIDASARYQRPLWRSFSDSNLL
jgi:hypothetical protein